MYVRIVNGAPSLYSERELRRDYPQVSFPATIPDSLLAEYGAFPVADAPVPDHQPLVESVHSEFVRDDKTWTRQWSLIPRDIDLVREELHARRRERRNAAELGGFVYRGRRIDSDRDSVQRIAHAAALALQASLTNTLFSLSWTCADDTELDLDAVGMLAMQSALAEHGARCHARSRELRTVIDGAATLADLGTVAEEIENGWPCG